MKLTNITTLILLPILLYANEGKIDMHGGKDQKLIPNNPIHKEKIYYAKILEIKPVMGYKYLKVNENGTIRWVAISNAPVKVGQMIGYDKKTIMKNFKSKILGKTFKEIIFANDIYLQRQSPLFSSLKDTLMTNKEPSSSKDIDDKKPSKPFVKKESYTVEEVHIWRKYLKNKTITVKGKIYKVAKNIMKRDWVHLGDGTGNEKDLSDDLVFTATNTNLKRGQEIKASGVVKVDKDFGYGYFYPVIVEDAHFEKIGK